MHLFFCVKNKKKNKNIFGRKTIKGLRKSADTFHGVKKSLDPKEILEVVKEILRVESYITFLETDVDKELKEMKEEEI